MSEEQATAENLEENQGENAAEGQQEAPAEQAPTEEAPQSEEQAQPPAEEAVEGEAPAEEAPAAEETPKEDAAEQAADQPTEDAEKPAEQEPQAEVTDGDGPPTDAAPAKEPEQPAEGGPELAVADEQKQDEPNTEAEAQQISSPTPGQVDAPPASTPPPAPVDGPEDIITDADGKPIRAPGAPPPPPPAEENTQAQDPLSPPPPMAQDRQPSDAQQAEESAPPVAMETGSQPPPSTPAPEQAINTVPYIPEPPPPMEKRPPTAGTPVDKVYNDALNLIWSFGMNKNVPVINLTDDTRRQIAYVCAHTGVMYDFENNTQTLLQGHANPISCICVSGDKRWLCTADKGDDAMIIVWDSYTGVPVRTIFDPHPDGGVNAIAITPDAKCIATISAAETQTLALWDWTTEGDEPLCTAELKKEYGMQHYIHFNPADTNQIVTNSDHQVIFYSWNKNEIAFFAPPLCDEDFNKQVGKYSQTIYMQNSTRALTATSVGNLVVWDTNKPFSKNVNSLPTPDKKALKLLKMQDRGISVLTTTDEFIVSGDVLGHVKFFDQTLKLMNWYQDFHLGPVNSLSFAFLPEFDYMPGPNAEFPPDATIRAKDFVVRDFVVGTTSAVYAHVTTDGTNVEVIHRDHDSAVHALAPHPSLPRIAVGGYSGLLKVWNYEERDTLASRQFERGHIRCCAFDPQGNYLAVGFTNGTFRVLDGLSLEDVQAEPYRYARDAITHAVFSHNSEWLATADGEFTVSLYRRQVGVGLDPYLYVGRHRAHYKTIKELMFGVQLDSDLPRLLSLGEDRHLVEYDLENSSKDNLPLMTVDRIEQSAVPQCIAWYPPVTKESFIVTANDQFKFKLYNATTKMCRRTLLGPTYGTPLQKLSVLATSDPLKDTRYVAYITHDKVGLHSLALDGNPHKSMALIAHPQGVANLATSYDGRFVFTAGGNDATVHMWYINKDALEAQTKLGGEDLIPFYGLLDGGREGELFRELEDYFYYAQLRSQGVDTMDCRESSTQINLSEVPFVMRALGFYPSEQEVEDMLNEVKFSRYVETGTYTEKIDLGDFIKLYINHRPAFGLEPDKMEKAFEVLGFPTEEGFAIDRGDLLDILQNRGEHMTEYELAEYLTTLMGYNEEGGSSELHEFEPASAGDLIDQTLPLDITARLLSDELLGFGMYADVLPIEAEEGQVAA